MRKILKSIFRIILLLVVFGICAFLYSGYSTSKNEVAISQPIAERLLPAIITDWNDEELIKNLATDFQIGIVSTDDKEAKILFIGKDIVSIKQKFSEFKNTLGTMKSRESIKCKATVINHILMTVCGVGIAQFEHGKAIVGFGFVGQGNERKIAVVNTNLLH